jgi:hypothetical protein
MIIGVGCDLWPFGPSRSVAGNWRFVEGKSAVFEMSLTQTDDRISGTVCTYPQGFLGQAPVREAPVSGDYPRMRVAFGTCEYDMLFDEDQDQIAGDCDGRRLVRFSRGGSGRCEGSNSNR